MNGAVRVFGVGGLWSYHGHFRNDSIGDFMSFVTNPQSCVILKLKNGKKPVVISVDDREKFLKTLSDYEVGK